MKDQRISEFEFISLMASLMALSALSIDALLPGLDEIGKAIGTVDPRENQFLITIIVLGLGIGQLISGALSDSIGRKPTMYIGCVIFAMASIICVSAFSLEVMIMGRLLQGIGLSAPANVSMAIIRDKYSGNHMAKIMSYITVIFILTPVIAPTFGKVLLDNFGWESIFYSQLIFGLFVTIWFWQRQQETLKRENRKKINWELYTNGVKEFFKHPEAIIYTIIAGLISGPFLAYMSASQQIFSKQYDLEDVYSYIFSGLALGIGIATFLNGTLVVKYGMQRMVTIPMIVLLGISTTYVVLFGAELNPDSTIFILFLAFILFSMGFIFGNLNALAMQPIGHIAGIGASIVSFISTTISVSIAALIGRFINLTALPIFIGFSVCVAISLVMMLIATSALSSVKRRVWLED
ncbi:MAG: multidrug effflux MFS transporter [Chitinophagales bacterium]|nr:multidrug effflux MFS transporter [Chitinophagales bacterium]